MQSLREAAGEMPPALEKAIRYLETQQDWLGNYERWQEQGYPVGSGLVEWAVAIVITLLMKKSGMRWKRANTAVVVALRVQRINADWEAAAVWHPKVGGICPAKELDNRLFAVYSFTN